MQRQDMFRHIALLSKHLFAFGTLKLFDALVDQPGVLVQIRDRAKRG